MKKKVSIVKFGGSVITNKSGEEQINEENILSLMSQLKLSGESVVLVHGAGSFGHPLAKKYDLILGDNNPSKEKMLAVSRTHLKVQNLNSEILRIGTEVGLPLFPLPPSAFVLEENKDSFNFEKNIISNVLDAGFIPVLYGDMVISQSRKFTVLSGDISMHHTAFLLQQSGFDVGEVIYVTDVDGLYSEDPKINPKAEIIGEVSLENFDTYLNNASGSSTTDVTKGMYGKLLEIQVFLKKGINVSIINFIEDRLFKCLSGEAYTGTKFSS